MKVGAEPKKIGILVALLLFAGFMFWYNSGSGAPDDAAPAARPQATAPQAAVPPATGVTPVTPLPSAPPAGPAPRTRVTTTGRGGREDFRYTMRPRRTEDRVDPATIDPTLRLDLLAKLENVKMQGGERSLFDFGSAPAPKPMADVKIVPTKPVLGPKPPPPPEKPVVATKPPAPPIPLKFYGYATPVKQGIKRAFFLEGDEIIVAAEGELIKKRYKVVRIGLSSAVVEDTQHQHQQTLPLEEQMG